MIPPHIVNMSVWNRVEHLDGTSAIVYNVFEHHDIIVGGIGLYSEERYGTCHATFWTRKQCGAGGRGCVRPERAPGARDGQGRLVRGRSDR